MNFLYFTVGVLAILGETVKTVECFSTTTTISATQRHKCNGSTIGDCIPVNEEFLMESEISRRILVEGNGYQPLNPIKHFCDEKIYGSCLGEPNTMFKTNRPCTFQNLCAGHGN
ncbi:unnamed protein product [Fraxinus pennsylvanica]|uniref:Secreted protein n=1 Tax=Fraxinus pennsylvanica TaxID=56036 RepID=A0AAD2EA00_9LAMI|nr:unnamed protein product [Fraxinus pennsylvanica]